MKNILIGTRGYDYEYSEGEMKEFVPVVHVATEEGKKYRCILTSKDNNEKILKEMVAS